MLLGTGIYAHTGQKMSFEETQQKKEAREKAEVRGNKQKSMSKEQWKSMSADEQYQYQMQMMQAEAVKEAPENLEYIKKEYKKGTLYPPADTSILKLGGAKYKQAVPVLIEILKNYNVADIRVSTAEALGNIGDPLAIPVLKEALGYNDYRIKVEAAVALVKLGRIEEAFPILEKVAKKGDVKNWQIDMKKRYSTVTFMSEEEKSKRRAETVADFKEKVLPSKAIRCLGSVGDAKSSAVIKNALQDKNEFVRLRAGSEMMEMDKNAAIPVLEKIIFDGNVSRSVRSAAMSALAKGKGEKEKNILKRYVRFGDQYLSDKAKKLIREMEGK